MNLLTDTRAVAMTEGIIVIPFLIICWMGLEALTALYADRLAVENEAAARVMQMAAAGQCTESSSETVAGAAPMNREESDLLSRIGASNPMCLAHSRATITRKSAHRMLQRDPDGADVKGQRVMMCNTVAADGLTDLIVSNVRNLLGL